jgi:hypothetical protein
MDRNELALDPRHVGVPSGGSKMITKPMVRSVQTVHLSCTDINTTSIWTKTSLNPFDLGVPSAVPKTISEPIARSAQTTYPSCVKINTVSKWTEMSYHFIHVTWEYHRVRPKWFSSLWYIRCKPCPCLALRLTLSPNRPKRASTWPASPGSSIEWPQKQLLA